MVYNGMEDEEHQLHGETAAVRLMCLQRRPRGNARKPPSRPLARGDSESAFPFPGSFTIPMKEDSSLPTDANEWFSSSSSSSSGSFVGYECRNSNEPEEPYQTMDERSVSSVSSTPSFACSYGHDSHENGKYIQGKAQKLPFDASTSTYEGYTGDPENRDNGVECIRSHEPIDPMGSFRGVTIEPYFLEGPKRQKQRKRRIRINNDKSKKEQDKEENGEISQNVKKRDDKKLKKRTRSKARSSKEAWPRPRNSAKEPDASSSNVKSDADTPPANEKIEMTQKGDVHQVHKEVRCNDMLGNNSQHSCQSSSGSIQIPFTTKEMEKTRGRSHQETTDCHDALRYSDYNEKLHKMYHQPVECARNCDPFRRSDHTSDRGHLLRKMYPNSEGRANQQDSFRRFNNSYPGQRARNCDPLRHTDHDTSFLGNCRTEKSLHMAPLTSAKHGHLYRAESQPNLSTNNSRYDCVGSSMKSSRCSTKHNESKKTRDPNENAQVDEKKATRYFVADFPQHAPSNDKKDSVIPTDLVCRLVKVSVICIIFLGMVVGGLYVGIRSGGIESGWERLRSSTSRAENSEDEPAIEALYNITIEWEKVGHATRPNTFHYLQWNNTDYPVLMETGDSLQIQESDVYVTLQQVLLGQADLDISVTFMCCQRGFHDVSDDNIEDLLPGPWSKIQTCECSPTLWYEHRVRATVTLTE